MPRSFTEAPRLSATDAAAALMGGDDAPDTAAPESTIVESQPEVREVAETQPERGRARQSNGRFAPAAEEGTQEEAPTETATGEPDEVSTLRAQVEHERKERERLQTIYRNNVEQQRAALEAARKEADEARQEKVRERERLLAEARAEVNALPEADPRKIQAERDLANYELAEERRRRTELEAEQTTTREQQRVAQAQQADAMVRNESWRALENWTVRRGRELGLTAAEAESALATLKNDDVARLFRELPARSLIEHTREVLGHRLDAELVRVAESRTENNRQEAIASGAHSHPRSPQQQPAAPAYERFTRNGDNHVRLGRKAAMQAIMAGALDE